MRIERIELKNYRQYRDVTFAFPKDACKKDMHIILGKNGEGKTNMLNAITWCLYNLELHLGDKNQALEIINSSYVEELRGAKEQYGDVSVAVELSSGDESQQHIRISRSLKFSINSDSVRNIGTSFGVMERTTGDWRAISDEDECNNMIHRYVPQEINQYIFFDGEQLEKYFHKVQKEHIQSGIEELTQASVLQKAIKGLEKYLKNDLNPKTQDCSDTEVQKCQEEVEVIEKNISKFRNNIAEYKSQITKCDNRIEELTNYIGNFTNIREKLERIKELEVKSDDLTREKKDIWNRLMVFTREYYQYMALYPAMKEFYDYIEKQENAGHLPPKIDKSFLTQFLNSPNCLICGSPLTEEHKKEIENLIDKISLGSASAAELNSASSAIISFFDIIKKYPSEKQKHLDELKSIEVKIEKNDDEYTTLHNEIKSVSNPEEIAKAIDERDVVKKNRDDLTMKIGAERVHLDAESKKLDDANERLNKAMEKNKQFATLKKKIEYCKNTKQILGEIKEEILEECRNEMQEETFKIFKELLWKKDAFSKVVIEEDYTFKLIDNYGNQTLGSSSAGERVLLALSFTLALQKISRHDSLLYIDTPVGRVDNENRKNFMSALLNVADEKQVILTFTPSEYNHAIMDVLGESYSSFTTLKMKNNVTTLG